jgi:hypothetical protein
VSCECIASHTRVSLTAQGLKHDTPYGNMLRAASDPNARKHVSLSRNLKLSTPNPGGQRPASRHTGSARKSHCPPVIAEVREYLFNFVLTSGAEPPIVLKSAKFSAPLPNRIPMKRVCIRVPYFTFIPTSDPTSLFPPRPYPRFPLPTLSFRANDCCRCSGVRLPVSCERETSHARSF